MKKFLSILLAILLVLAFVGCDNASNQEEVTPTPNATPTATPTAQNGTVDVTHSLATGTLAPTVIPTAAPTAPTPTPAGNGSNASEHQHSWGEWTMETKAFVNKPGADKRVCSLCKQTETRPRSANATYNSFYDFGYQYALSNDGALTTFGVFGYACSALGQYSYKPTPVATVVNELKKYFVFDSQFEAKLIEDMKKYNYNAQTDEITLEANAESGDFILKGFKHLGGNKYETYYKFSGFDIFEDLDLLYKIEVEFNRDKGQPNKMLSCTLIQSLPSDMTACQEGERME
ncbi:MAG: hypothetical protein IKB86_01425 [Clostridia bacterium]|nr:hypothetical protein [Clostridia bacterium]